MGRARWGLGGRARASTSRPSTFRAPLAALGLAIGSLVLGACADEPRSIEFDADLPTTTRRSTTSTAPSTTAAPASESSASTTTPTDPTSSGGADSSSSGGADSSSSGGAAPAVGATSTTTPATSLFRPLIPWRGETRYLHGANLPWVNFGCDFGCGPDGGMSDPEARAIAETAFAAASDAGMNTIRWWTFPEVATAFETDADGIPTGFNEHVLADLDEALELASTYDVQLVFTLFSRPTDLPAVWYEPAGRARLVDLLSELFERYRDTEVFTWQVMNEPEWEIWAGEVTAEPVQLLVRDVALAVHRHSDALVSVGGARLDGLELWQQLGLDYYTVHWYDPMQRVDQCALCVTYDDLFGAGIDLPVLIGEVWLGTEIDALSRMYEVRDRGYAGALGWSLLDERTRDGLDVDLDAAAAFSLDLEGDGDDGDGDDEDDEG